MCEVSEKLKTEASLVPIEEKNLLKVSTICFLSLTSTPSLVKKFGIVFDLLSLGINEFNVFQSFFESSLFSSIVFWKCSFLSLFFKFYRLELLFVVKQLSGFELMKAII